MQQPGDQPAQPLEVRVELLGEGAEPAGGLDLVGALLDVATRCPPRPRPPGGAARLAGGPVANYALTPAGWSRLLDAAAAVPPRI